MIKKPFEKKHYYQINPKTVNTVDHNEETPRMINCPGCSAHLWEKDLKDNHQVCPRCSHHFTLGARERINMIVDPDSFNEIDADLASFNFLGFPGYDEKLALAREQSGLNEAVVTGYASLNKRKIVLGVMDSRFMMASMGSVVGEKICRAIELAMEIKSPLIIFASSGGARMQEGIISLMQMAKTSAAIGRFNKTGLPYISVLTHPTTGGVFASFASLADIIIAEKGALIGFAGARVIQQTIGTRLPEKFQRAEFLFEHGMLDLVVGRLELRQYLDRLLRLHQGGSDG
ncbi:MAG: acetyl-CoA carboxylase, carboxyltransferase subunit beta [Syntrophomonadaceae bacterium]